MNSIPWFVLGEKVFHAFGEKVQPNYPTDPGFWMDFDAVLMDLDALPELNATVVSSLKDFVQKEGADSCFSGPCRVPASVWVA